MLTKYIEEETNSKTEKLLFKYVEVLQPCTVRSIIEYSSKYYGFRDEFLNFDKVTKKLVKKNALVISKKKCQINPQYKGEVYEVNKGFCSKDSLNILYINEQVRNFLESALLSFEEAINSFNTINDIRSFHKFVVNMNNAWQLILFSIACDSSGITAIFTKKDLRNNGKKELIKLIPELDSDRSSTKNIFTLKRDYLVEKKIINNVESVNIDFLNILRDEIEHFTLNSDSIKHKYWVHWQANISLFIKVVNNFFPGYLNQKNYTLAIDIAKLNVQDVSYSEESELDDFIRGLINESKVKLSEKEMENSPYNKTILLHTIKLEDKENVESLINKCLVDPVKARELLQDIRNASDMSSKEFYKSLEEMVDDGNKTNLLHQSHCYKYANIFGVTKDQPLAHTDLCIYDYTNNPPCYKYSKKFAKYISKLINRGQLSSSKVQELWSDKKIISLDIENLILES